MVNYDVLFLKAPLVRELVANESVHTHTVDVVIGYLHRKQLFATQKDRRARRKNTVLHAK